MFTMGCNTSAPPPAAFHLLRHNSLETTSKEETVSTVMGSAHSGTHSANMETAHSFKCLTHEHTSPSSTHPLTPQNSMSKAQEQQQWIWVV